MYLLWRPVLFENALWDSERHRSQTKKINLCYESFCAKHIIA